MLEVRTGDRAPVKMTVEGTVLDGVPQLVAVDGLEFCRPVRLQGHLVICRCAATCATEKCNVDALRGIFDELIIGHEQASC